MDDGSIRCPKCGLGFPTGRALGGHAKTHNERYRGKNLTRIGSKPDCFDDEADWLNSAERLFVEYPTRRLTHEFALSEACAVCPMSYMLEAEAAGRCHPPQDAMTPRVRAAAGLDDEEDEAA